MALPALPLETVLAFSRKQLEQYFMEYARQVEVPAVRSGYPTVRSRHAIQIGSKVLYADGPRKLREKFEKFCDNAKRYRSRGRT